MHARVRKPAVRGALLGRTGAPVRAVSAIVLFGGSVLRDNLDGHAETAGAFEKGLVCDVVLYVGEGSGVSRARHAHATTHGIETVLEFGREEVREATVGPFFAHGVLGLQARGPVYRATSSESAAGENHDVIVVGCYHATIFHQMFSCFGGAHGEVRRGEMVTLFENETFQACPRKVRGNYACAAAGADDDDICREVSRRGRGCEVVEFEIITVVAFNVSGDGGKVDYLRESG